MVKVCMLDYYFQFILFAYIYSDNYYLLVLDISYSFRFYIKVFWDWAIKVWAENFWLKKRSNKIFKNLALFILASLILTTVYNPGVLIWVLRIWDINPQPTISHLLRRFFPNLSQDLQDPKLSWEQQESLSLQLELRIE